MMSLLPDGNTITLIIATWLTFIIPMSILAYFLHKTGRI